MVFSLFEKGVIQEQDRHLDFYILRAKGMKIKLDRLEGLAGFEDAVAKTLLRLLCLHGFLVPKAFFSFFFCDNPPQEVSRKEGDEKNQR